MKETDVIVLKTIREENQMRIAIDLDGVIWDFQSRFMNLYNQEYNENVRYEDVLRWDFYPKKRWERVYKRATKQPYKFSLIDIAIPIYMRILNLRHRVSILTHGNYPVLALKDFLEKLGIEVGREYNELIIDHTGTPKTEFDFDIFIDDNPNMINECMIRSQKFLLLYNHPWNKNSVLPKNVIRIYNWSDIICLFFTKELNEHTEGKK